jgi:hypothetical protein
VLKCTLLNIHVCDFLVFCPHKQQIARAYSSQRRNRQRSILRPYTLHVLFIPPAQLPNVCLTAQLHRHATPFPFLNTPNTLDRDRFIVPAVWSLVSNRLLKILCNISCCLVRLRVAPARPLP